MASSEIGSVKVMVNAVPLEKSMPGLSAGGISNEMIPGSISRAEIKKNQDLLPTMSNLFTSPSYAHRRFSGLWRKEIYLLSHGGKGNELEQVTAYHVGGEHAYQDAQEQGDRKTRDHRCSSS